MVLIAAAVCNKTGKAIISRQFVELTKSRIEVFEKRKLAIDPFLEVYLGQTDTEGYWIVSSSFRFDM